MSETGKLDASLRRAAERYDRELDKDLQRIMALIMPSVLIVMALLIGTMAYLVSPRSSRRYRASAREPMACTADKSDVTASSAWMRA